MVPNIWKFPEITRDGINQHSPVLEGWQEIHAMLLRRVGGSGRVACHILTGYLL